MRLQEHVIAKTREAFERAFRAARAFPEDRLEWRPMDVGQSVLSMCREMAKTPDWAYFVLTDAEPDSPEDAARQQREEMESWRTVDDCERACASKLERLFDLYRSMPDVRLLRTKWLPFNGGRDHTCAELLEYPRWNLTYHEGQMAYVRTLDGDLQDH